MLFLLLLFLMAVAVWLSWGREETGGPVESQETATHPASTISKRRSCVDPYDTQDLGSWTVS